MLDRVAGNAAAMEAVKAALAQGRLSHSVLLLGEEGAGAGFCARCLAADWLYPEGGAAAEAVGALHRLVQSGDALLAKASRGMKLEDILADFYRLGE